MKELEFINTISKIIKNNYIGDDCAHLEDLGITISQDSFAEDIHFKTDWSTPYQIGYKCATASISDIYASGAKPKYVTIGLSLPTEIDNSFVESFYKGATDALEEVQIVGGDITGSSDKIFVSITVIGDTNGRRISSRKNAKVGHKIITNGEHGASFCGLSLLKNGITDNKLTDAHLTPKIDGRLSEELSLNAKSDYAMMDSSDGLADALIKIAEASKVSMTIDFSKIPINDSTREFCTDDIITPVLFGGEDFKIIATVDEELLNSLDKNLYTVIGEVIESKNKTEYPVFVDFSQCDICINNKKINELKLTQNDLDKNCFDHFKYKNGGGEE